VNAVEDRIRVGYSRLRKPLYGKRTLTSFDLYANQIPLPGSVTSRHQFSKVWRGVVEKAKAPTGTGFRALRHYYEGLRIRHGESVKVVQSRLGHATAAETLDTYSHLWPDSADRTRAAVETMLLSAVSPVCQVASEQS